MSLDAPSLFPTRIADPNSRRTGSLYVVDFAMEGLSVGRLMFERAICTLARECTTDPLSHIDLLDEKTVLVETETGTRTQLDLFYKHESLNAYEVERLWKIRRDDADRLAFATAGSVTADAHAVCVDHDITLLKMDTDHRTKTRLWKPQ